MGERREFLERSLVDLDEEHDAGDLSDDDHARLRAEYEERLAILDGTKRRPTATTPPPRPAWHRIATWGGVAAFALVAGILLAQYAGRRTGDQNITGIDVGGEGGEPVTTPEVDPALARCFDLAGGDALQCYIDYTEVNPEDPEGFLYLGLFSINQGLQSDIPELLSGGEAFLRRALVLDPELHEARVNLAVFLERTGRDDEAADELAQLAGVELTDDLQQLVEFVQGNLAEGGDGSTTTTPSTTTTTAG